MHLPRIIENMMIGKTVKIAYVKILPHDASLSPIVYQISNWPITLPVIFPLKYVMTSTLYIVIQVFKYSDSLYRINQ